MKPITRRAHKKLKTGWGCVYCNMLNKKDATICKNCKKLKKVGSPFSLHF